MSEQTNVKPYVNCALCGADDARRLFRPARSPGPVVKCRRCNLIYISPREETGSLISNARVIGDLPSDAITSNDVSLLSGSWELPIIQAKEREQEALRLNGLLALQYIGHCAPSTGRLLDFGCGTGHFLRVAMEQGWQCYGLEPLVGHAVYARHLTHATIVADTLGDHLFPEQFFDVITAFQVFEHLPDPASELDKLSKILKTGGLLLIEVPNIDTWSMHIFGSRHRHFVQDHVYFFSSKTLSALLVRHGFKPLLTYRPRRAMTIQHLAVDWGKRLLGQTIASTAQKLAHHFGIKDRLLWLDLGDIVAVIAAKV